MISTEFGRWVLQSARRLIGVWLIVLGTVLVISGDGRISGSAYDGMRHFAGWLGASPSLLWGCAAIACGTLMWPQRTRLVGLTIGLFWVFLYGLGFLLAINDPHTSATAGVTYVFIAINVAGVLVLERDRDRP